MADAVPYLAFDGNAAEAMDFYHSVFGGELIKIDDDEAKLEGWFNQLSEGAKVTLPFEKQFWGDTFGQLVDKFGQRWMFNANTAH